MRASFWGEGEREGASARGLPRAAPAKPLSTVAGPPPRPAPSATVRPCSSPPPPPAPFHASTAAAAAARAESGASPGASPAAPGWTARAAGERSAACAPSGLPVGPLTPGRSRQLRQPPGIDVPVRHAADEHHAANPSLHPDSGI